MKGKISYKLEVKEYDMYTDEFTGTTYHVDASNNQKAIALAKERLKSTVSSLNEWQQKPGIFTNWIGKVEVVLFKSESGKTFVIWSNKASVRPPKRRE
jgi:hypothetical protein